MTAQELRDEELLDSIKDTIKWANEMSDIWVGTLHQEIIDEEVAELEAAVAENNLVKARILMGSLGEVLHNSTREFELV